MLNYMAPVALAANRAEQLLQPFITEHQHWVSIDNELCLFCAYTPLLELLGLQQMEVILFAIALDPLL